jgi:prepilin-type N-terminal cleavage/methylation domain-containing protein
MTAIHASSATRSRSGARLLSPPTPRGFTLTELLIVIALIVLLITLLLAALDAVQDKARETRSLATMQAFTNACNAFQQEQGFYPGVVPENILAYDAAQNQDNLPGISGTENAMLHLTGGYMREDDVTDAEWDAFAGQLYVFSTPSGGFYRIKVNFDRIGEGPTVNGKAYPPYFTPGEKEFAAAPGQASPTGFGQAQRALPDVIDAWGQPIAFLRRMRTVGPLTPDGSASPAQFSPAPIRSYTRSTGLGRLNRNQVEMSILNTTSEPNPTLARILEHPALPGQARGAFMLLSAGPDAIFFSREDGPGSPETPVDDIYDPDVYPAGVIDEYDDVLIFGGD